jgi:hypothetical protein
MNKVISSIFFFLFLVTLTASDVSACKCELPSASISIERHVKSAYNQYSAIFLGDVIEVIEEPGIYSLRVKFRINKTWKSEISKEIFLSTGRGGGDCGYEFKVGKKYLVYATGENNLSTSICSRTAPAEPNQDLAILNKIKKPKVKSSPK